METLFTWNCCLVLLTTAALGDVDACGKRRSPRYRNSPLAITSWVPADTLILGNDLTVHYRVAPGVAFQAINLRVTNKAGELVYLSEKLPVSAGRHRAVWPKAKWNQPPHAGALANPRNGPYTVALSAKARGRGTISCVTVLPTQLVLDCDLEHGKPSKDEISSGLSRPMLDPKSPARLRIGLVPQGGKVGQTVYALAPPTFSKLVEEDLDKDPSELEVKSVHVQQVMQPSFGDGVYHVVLTNLRTAAGTRGVDGMPEGVVETWTITLR
jgi:hypothetical protein